MKRKTALTIAFCFLLPLVAGAQVLVGGGNVRFTPKGAGQVLFSHEKHVAANGRRCSGCHFGVFQMEKGSHKMNMSKLTKGHFCGSCHNGSTAFDLADKTRCKTCHR